MPDFTKLFASGEFIPHGHCYLWNPELLSLHILSDALIGLAYYSISLTLVYFVRQRQDLPFNWAFLLFSVFIAVCGTTHLLEVWTLWHPTYWLLGLLKGVNALISVYTASALIPLIFQALAIPSLAQLEATNRQLEIEIGDRVSAQRALYESQQMLQLVMDNIPQMIFWKDRDSVYLGCNQNFARVAGVGKSENVVGKTDYDLPWRQEESDWFRECDARVMETNQPECHILESQLQADGKQSWVDTNKIPLLDAEGKVVGILGTYEDITKSRRQEERLRLLESVVINASDAVLITKAEPIEAPGPPIIYVNEAFTRMTGYSLEEALGKTTAQFLHGPKTDQAVLEQIRTAVRAYQSILVELLNYRKDGTEFWVELSVVPVADKTGCCTHWISVERDITERKRQEERLRLLESVVINANDAVLITEAEPIEDSGPRIIYANEAFTRITGYSLEEVLGRTPRLLQGPKTDQAATEQINMALQVWQPIVVELLNYRKNGTEFWVELSIAPVADATGWYTHWISIQRDITERKHGELALQQSEAKTSALLNALPDLMLRISRSGTYLECKPPKNFEMVMPISEMLGKNQSEVLPAEVAQQYQHYREQALVTDSIQVFDYEVPINGRKRHREARIVKSAENEVLQIVRDITEHKRAELQLQESLAEKEVLLREIHHRVKNNLQVISSLLRLQAGYIDDPQALEMFQASQNRVRAMSLIHEQLYQSKDLAKIDLAEYVSRLINNIRRSYSVTLRPVKFKIDISDVSLGIDAVIPCGLIINELVSNALKHSFSEAELTEIDINLYHSNTKQYLLTVKDNGIGLPVGLDLETINSLGLKLVSRLVRQLQGEIKFYNQGGAVFQITFPQSNYEESFN